MLKRIVRFIDEWLVGDYTPSCAGFLPLLIGGAMLAAKFLKGKGQQSAAKEQSRVDAENLAARKANWAAGQKIRGGRLDAVKGLLGGLQGHLAAGAPSYQFDPTAFETMKTEVPYAEAATTDRSKGMGWDMAGDLTQTAGSLGQSYMAGLGGAAGAAGGGGVSNVAFNPQQYTPFNPALTKDITAPTLH